VSQLQSVRIRPIFLAAPFPLPHIEMRRDKRVKPRLLEPVRRLLADAAADLLERGAETPPSRRESRLAEAQAVLRDQLGLLHVERHRTAKEIAAANAGIDAGAGKAELALRAGREDLAHAAVRQQADLEARLARLRDDHTAITSEIAILERAAATLADALSASPATRDPHAIAAKLAELDLLIATQADGETAT
jgi:hypothetical protein